MITINKEHWKIEIIKNLMKDMDEGIKSTITRGEKHDAERTIRFYQLGREFERSQKEQKENTNGK
jgi:hypothetical protein